MRSFTQTAVHIILPYYPDGVPGYEEVGNTAYITFDSFAIPNPNDMDSYYRVEDVNEFADTDTIGLIMKAHAQITREDSPIENVVLDLTNNEGGAADAAVFVLGWLLGEASIGVENTMTGAMSSAIFMVPNAVYVVKDLSGPISP